LSILFFSGKAKSFDPDFKGPIKSRSCTDILCCLLFFVFILGYIVIGIFGKSFAFEVLM